MKIKLNQPSTGEEEVQAVAEVIRSGNLLFGDKVKQFEEDFAKYLGAKHVIATSSGTTALHTALLASGIGPSHEVITTPFSFVATASSILHAGAKPVFVDIEEDSFNLNPDLIEEKINKKTKVILPVSLYGNPCSIDKIFEIAEIKAENELFVIEDCAQAHGSEFRGQKVGSNSFISTFSFDPTKNMTAGCGGAVVTDYDFVAEKARMIRVHGAKKQYHHEFLGYNFKLSDVHAAIAIEQLKKLPKILEDRIANAEYLSKYLSGIDWLKIPKVDPENKHNFHKYTIRITGKNRDEVAKKLAEAEIETKVFYPKLIPEQELFKNLGYKEKLPVAEKAVKEVLSLPVHHKLTKGNLDYIIETFYKI